MVCMTRMKSSTIADANASDDADARCLYQCRKNADDNVDVSIDVDADKYAGIGFHVVGDSGLDIYSNKMIKL